MLDGGPEQYRPFVQAYGSYIYKTVYAVLQSPHDAEDATQEVLLQIYRSLPEYRGDGLKTWITRIAVNRAVDFKRKRARRQEQLFEDEAAAAQTASPSAGSAADAGWRPAAPAQSAEAVALKRASRMEVHKQMQALPPNYRDVISAFYIEEKSYEQIALDTGLEPKSVESRLYRARNWMKRNWRKEDFE